ncbi:alcohol dehydrogenase catalytic domain-containing protein [Streptomyces muensis]|uniref:Zinc-binding dehydrogenase n=1 Tax=Streptomyces muensis TaxID=1077944 RepID=A0A9X1TJ24_STRM4|nr:zinc-binding dehydrogenase [Streptomyces muensis]MCF1592600.1 zinc-binding dehydrogenase [Streptomyces muensis]
MKAWQYVSPGMPLTEVDLPDPVAGPGQVVIDVKAAGLCQTDVSFLDGHVPGMPVRLPMVLGHEVAGVISSRGEGVTEFEVGERVVLAPIGDPFGGPGVGRDGGYAEQTVGLVPELVRIPEGVSYAQAATATDAGCTAYHAVKVLGGIEAGTRLGVIGLGGVGQFAARIGVLQGAEVYVADIREEQGALARELGAIEFFTDAAGLSPLGLDVIIDFAGVDTTGVAVDAVRPGGRVVQIGATKPDARINLVSLVTRGVSLLGALGGDRSDVTAVIELLATGRLNPAISTLPFDGIGRGIDALRHSQGQGRSVAIRPS